MDWSSRAFHFTGGTSDNPFGENAGLTLSGEIVNYDDFSVERELTPGEDPENAASWETTVREVRQQDTRLTSHIELAKPDLISGAQVGVIFGSSLGQVIGGDNVFAQVAAGSALSTVLINVGQSFDLYANGSRVYSDGSSESLSFEEAGGIAFDNIDVEFGAQIRSSGVGFAASFLTAELAESLGINGDGFGDQLFNYAANTAITSVLDAGLAAVGAGLEITDAFTGALFASQGTSYNPFTFVGRYLANEIVSPENVGGSIGQTVGSAIGGIIGGASAVVTAVSAFTGASQVLLNIVLPGIGALIGAVLGTLLGNVIGNLFGGDQDWSVQDVRLETGGTQFSNPVAHSNTTGNSYTAYNNQLARATQGAINGFLVAIGGKLISNDVLSSENRTGIVRFLTGRQGNGTYIEDNVVVVGSRGASLKTHSKTEDRVAWATLKVLKFSKIAGGNLYIKRAIASSQATTLEQFAGELKIAEDYGRYLANKDAINALIALDPNSAFAAGWLITLLRAEELGVTEMAVSDFYGGISSFLKSFNLDRFDASLADVSFSLDGDNLNITINNGVDEARVVEVEDYVALTGLSYLSADATGAQVTGGDAGELWFADSVDSTFVDHSRGLDAISSDTLIGNSGNDTITAGVGHDYIQGNGGNDVIDAGTGDDVIVGGTGDDIIQGGLGDDVYVFERGDGVDTIEDFGVALERRISLNGGETADDIYQATYTVLAQEVNVGGIYSPSYVLRARNANYSFSLGSAIRSYHDLSPEQLANLPVSAFVLANGSNTTTSNFVGGTTQVPTLDVTLNVPASETVTEYVRDANGNDVALTVGAVVDGGIDTLQFGHGLTSEDVVAEIDGQDLVLALTDPDHADATFADLTDKITLENWFDSNQRVESLAFVDGTVVTTLGILSMLDPSGDVAGSVVGNDDVFVGAGANDTIVASDGDDIVLGRAGNDTLTGGAGDDILLGGAGRDFLYGGDGDDTLDAGANDTGSWQYQYLYGQGGDDTYLYSQDAGFVFIGYETATTGEADQLILTDLNVADLVLSYYDYGSASPHGNTLVLDWFGEGSTRGRVFATNEGEHIERYEFADGTTLSGIGLNASGALELTGTSGDDTIIGSDGADIISGFGGDDEISGLAGDDTLTGGAGDDILLGGAGADILNGGAGNDTLDAGSAGVGWQSVYGQDGNDTYLYSKDSGLVYVATESSTSGDADRVVFSDLNVSDLTVGYAVNNELRLSWTEAGSYGELQITDAGQYIETYQFADGTTLSGIGLTASGDLELVGTSGDDTIIGSDGIDVISGGAG